MGLVNTKRYFGTSLSGRAGCAGLLFLLFCIVPLSLCAQQQDPASRALQKAQGMLRQLSSEKKALEAEVAGRDADLAKAQTELARVQDQVIQQQNMSAAMAENNAALVERIKSDYGKIQQIIAKYRALQADLGRYQQDHELLKNAVAERDHWISECRKNNTELIAQGKNLLARYNDKSLWDSLVESEPALGLGKVDVELEDQEYRFKLEDLKVRPPAETKLPLKAQEQNHAPGSAASPGAADPGTSSGG